MTKTISLLQFLMALGIGLTLAGCDTISDAANSAGDAASNVVSALDPTGWFGGDATPAPATGDDTPPSADSAASTTPDLANLPSRPATTTTAQQQATAQSLAADGAQARYSADALRAGTEAAAAPPSAADVPPSAQLAMAAPPANSQPPTADRSPPAVGPAASSAAAAPPPAAPPPSALNQGTAAVPVPAGIQSTPMPPPQQQAAVPAGPPPGAEPAVPPNTPVRGSALMSSQFASDSALGFQPSNAPPLDASINQWVPAPVVARYRQTASGAGVAPVRVPAVPPKLGAGGREDMSGAVTTNLDAISAPGASIAAMNGGVAPTAVVYFPGDGTALSAAARAQIRSAADQYKAMGGSGSIRVVGHASSRTANMPVEKHLEVIFQKSQARANAVAQELIHEGVPAARVLIDAVGDSQPVYYESMPQGEEGNRRAEIFVQG